jgi:hypothetical protein
MGALSFYRETSTPHSMPQDRTENGGSVHSDSVRNGFPKTTAVSIRISESSAHCISIRRWKFREGHCNSSNVCRVRRRLTETYNNI